MKVEANPVIAVAPEYAVPPGGESRLELGKELQLGMLAGGSQVGDVDGPGIGVGLATGVRLADISLLGQLDYMEVGESDGGSAARHGSMVRAGLALRYQLADLAPESEPVGIDVWLELGAGRERIAWQGGGTASRTDLSIGVGLTLDSLSRRPGSAGTPSFGPYFSARTVLARTPATMASCQGPCDMSSVPTSGIDTSTIFSFGMHWGR